MSQPSFTGHRRQRKTPRSVARAERTARFFIYAGGFGTIVAIGLIFFFLVSVVVPLFGAAEGGEERVATSLEASDLLGIGCDEYRSIAWSLHRDGTLAYRELRTGKLIESRKLFDGGKLTAHQESFEPATATRAQRTRWIFGFEDGTIRSLVIAFDASFKEPPDVPEEIRALAVGGQALHEGGVAERTPKRQFRLVQIRIEMGDPVRAAADSIVDIDISFPPSGQAIAFLSKGGELAVATIERRLNMMTGEEEERAKKRSLPYQVPEGRTFPAHVALTGSGNELFLVWKDGLCIRYDSRSTADDGAEVPETERQAEILNLIEAGNQVRALAFLNGKSTLLVGDSGGRVHLWCTSRPEDSTTVDGIEMQHLRTLEGPRAPVTSIASSARSRLLLAAYGNGEVRAFQGTRGSQLIRLESGAAQPIAALALAPKEDAIIAADANALREWTFDAGYHDVSLSTMFLKVWYERQAEPRHEWQSSGGDDAEPQIGLMPLIWGTLKATFYSMLMAIPIALLAAVYTSEFMKPKVRAPVKSIIEMMASLPSVVLGFLAALVVAPFIAGVLPATLAALLTIPFAFVLGARLWQLLPAQKALAWGAAPKFIFMALMLPAGISVAVLLAPATESIFYDGDIHAWLNAGPGSGGSLGGWMFVLLPLCVLILAVGWSRWGAPWLRTRSFDWDRGTCARFDLGRLFALIVASLALAALLGLLLSQFGFDPRSDFMGKYSPRNALIVGFAMAFAIVPIIYTLSEDALSGVPSQLREGSLGAGATPWQTAVRIIIPTAMSGIFGAIMVGLGRAVGETMIVLMAAGNTPIMDFDAFNGFRALSANIATELPEAPRGGSHYRVLFFSALVLFAMTFVINTAAEVVRRRFRARYTEQL